jgi:hypothetical protein
MAGDGPKRQTCGTRHGNGKGHGGPRNGEGWGGERKGEGNRLAGPGRPPGVKNGEGKQARARAMLEEAAPLAAQVLVDVAANLDDPRALQAAQAILNRVGLHEKSGVEVGGPNGKALAVTVEIVDAAAPGDTAAV